MVYLIQMFSVYITNPTECRVLYAHRHHSRTLDRHLMGTQQLKLCGNIGVFISRKLLYGLCAIALLPTPDLSYLACLVRAM